MPANAILSDKGEMALLKVGAEIVFVRSSFRHLKSIADDQGNQMILKKDNFGQDAGVVDVNDKTAFIAAVKMCQCAREKTVLAI